MVLSFKTLLAQAWSSHHQSRAYLEVAAVFVAAFLLLSWRIGETRIAAAYIDPIVPVLAQDESVYVHSALRMSDGGDWLTPTVLGRLFLVKPPLLQWLTAASVRLLGPGLLAVRLPSLLAGAAGVAVVFAWTARGRNRTAAIVASILLASSPIWVTFSRLCYTDAIASTLVMLAVYCLATDPVLSSRRSRLLFGVFVAGALMARSIVGIVPLLAVGVYAAVAPPQVRPPIRNVLQSIMAGAIVALPWHIYQILMHPQWFWAEFVMHQLVAVGITEPTGVSGLPFFYIRRLAVIEPVLCLFVLFAVWRMWPTYVRRMKVRPEPMATVALSWAVVVVASLALFRGRSVSYLVLLVPALCVLAGLFLPRPLELKRPGLLGLLILTFAVKLQLHGEPWSIRYESPRLQSAAAVRWYYAQNRDAELIIAKPDDEFYSMTLPHVRMRYCFPDAYQTLSAVAPHQLYLGRAVTTAQFLNLSRLKPLFSARLRTWGVQSDEPIATAILLENPVEIRQVLRAAPGADFYLPGEWWAFLPEDISVKYEIRTSAKRLFLLDRAVQNRRTAPNALPSPW